MMRHLIWICVLGCPFLSLGQSTKNIEATFYGLPINASRNKLKTQLILDSRFSEKPNSDTSLFLGYHNSYWRNLVQHNLPTAFKIDSATIELTWGYGMFTKQRKKGHDLTFIKLKYFVSEIAISNELAKYFWNRHKNISSDTFDITVGRKEDNNFSYGKQVKIKRKKYLPTLSILQQEYNNKVFVVLVEYERLGN
jgi:hypothetical protein